MKAVVQRVLRAEVRIGGKIVSSLPAPGLLIYVGMTHTDGPPQTQWLARKIWDLRILRDEQSASGINAPMLVVSQFTLYADTSRGRRPSWGAAAPRPVAEPLVTAVIEGLRHRGVDVATGVFGAQMSVTMVGDGPVTILLDV